MREKDWFSRGVALSEECNRKHRERLRTATPSRPIIGFTAPAYRGGMFDPSRGTGGHALPRVGLPGEVLHSGLQDDERARIETALRNAVADVVVQVNILGEGYDLPTLSVAAVFRPYRSLAPYVQFVGRILRLAQLTPPIRPPTMSILSRTSGSTTSGGGPTSRTSTKMTKRSSTTISKGS